MDEKEKQIEEMARVYCDYCQNQIGERDCEYKLSKQCSVFDECEIFFNAGYRNCKDKVVLDQADIDEFRKDQAEVKFLKKQLQDQARKETAREFAIKLKENDLLKSLIGDGWIVSYVEICKVIDEIAKQYGVEVEE